MTQKFNLSSYAQSISA